MRRSQKISVLTVTAAAAALMAIPRLEGAQTPQTPSVKTGDHIMLPVDARPQTADFDQTIVGQAPLQDEKQADACFTQAVSFLATQRAALQKQCADGDGLFNSGTLTAELHRGSCTVSQMVTCTGTTATRQQEDQRKRAAADRRLNDLDGKPRRAAGENLRPAKTSVDPDAPKSEAVEPQ